MAAWAANDQTIFGRGLNSPVESQKSERLDKEIAEESLRRTLNRFDAGDQ
jgi:hypothetical protein